MFGMGGGEIILILVIALIFLGPEKLPDAAKSISKGIRDLRGATREISQTIENDEQIGGAIRDIKSALRGEDPRPKPRLPKKPPPTAALTDGGVAKDAAAVATATAVPAEAPVPASGDADASGALTPTVTLPPTAGERTDAGPAAADDGAALASLVRPPTGTIGRGARDATPEPASPDAAPALDAAPGADLPRG